MAIGLAEGTTYYYQVCAANAFSTSSVSATASATTAPPATASCLTTDTSTHGDWIGIYGANGYDLAGGPASIPSYARVTVDEEGEATWSSSTTDVRALQDPSNPPVGRLAAAWYSTTSFNIDLTDDRSHQVGLYLLDWDGAGARHERVDVIDAATGALLDSRDVSSFQNGTYLVWNLSGDIELIFTNESSGSNGVASALFFDPAAIPPLAPSALTASGNDASATLSWSEPQIPAPPASSSSAVPTAGQPGRPPAPSAPASPRTPTRG